MSACIIPVGPEFQDPPGIPDSAPEITFSDPPIGMATTKTAFTITVTDPNVGDYLVVRWLADYPDIFPGSHRRLGPDDMIRHSIDGTPLRRSSNATIDCLVTSLEPSLPVHRVMAIVADRDFEMSEDLTQVVGDGRTYVATWVWSVTCPPR